MKPRIAILDKLLVKSFVGPFIVTFFVAIFVLIMQTLWLYMDDIAGKGASIFLIIEFLAYLSVSLIPMALPIAVLISSVMVLGGLAEHYELSSFKSAGVPLSRVMRPLMVVAFVVSVFSFFCANNLMPVSNLKFKSRLFDIRNQKPTLSLEEGAFNDDFQNFAIRIGQKEDDNRTIHDVMMYDHNDATQGRMTQVMAERGQMYTTADEQFFIMDLYDGHQYMEVKSTASSNQDYPFVRTTFKEWEKIFDLSEFQIDRTDEELFKSHQSMLTSTQLQDAIDSIEAQIDERYKMFAYSVDNNFHFRKQERLEEIRFENAGGEEEEAAVDSLEVGDTVIVNEAPIAITADNVSYQRKMAEKRQIAAQRAQGKYDGADPIPQLEGVETRLDTFQTFLETFEPNDQRRLVDRAKSFVRIIKDQGGTAERSLVKTEESWRKHVYTLHNKYSMAIACLIFLFIGAPMGAIVRKGGFGYPILVSIIFFMIFVILTIFCKKIAETGVIAPSLGAWMPCIVLFPVGLLLTQRAMNDTKVLNVDRYTAFITKLFKKKEETGETEHK